MSRMFTPEPEFPGAPNTEIPVSEPVQNAAPEEFEFVLGRRQIASISLVVLTAIGACTTTAYVAGKSVGKVVTVAAPAPAPAPAPVQAAPAPVQATVQAAAPAVHPDFLDAPLSGVPEVGKSYIQLGSVERGFATLMAHGARKLGFPAFLAPGPTPNVYRVLSGPFATTEDAQKAKATFDAAGLNTFSRKYSEPVTAAATAPEQP